MDILAAFLGFLVGAVATLIAIYRYAASRISPEEAKQIYLKAKAAIERYNKAKEDGTITLEEKLEIAEDVLATLEELLKALKQEQE